MSIPLRHDNTLQMVPRESFNPLLQNESPYFSNLNRAPKNAYDYADSINKILSYGGHVILAKASSGSFSLEDIVKINDDDTASLAVATDGLHTRVGIVVTTANDDGYYVICLKCVNYILSGKALTAGTKFYLNLSSAETTAQPKHMSATKESSNSAHVGNYAIAVATGQNSIHFSGTIRDLDSLP